jgi:outer membrane lipoprotein-sorting protein
MLRLILIVIAWAAVAMADSSATIEQDTSQRLVSQVEAALNGITTMTADFEQITEDGDISHGTFYLQRPGRFRWQYKPPHPLLIVANRSLVTVYDYELKQMSHSSGENHLTALLARQHIQLGDDLMVIKCVAHLGQVLVTLESRKHPEEGQLTLILQQYPMVLEGFNMLDRTKKMTRVRFSHVQTGIPLVSELFIIKDPNLFGAPHRSSK